MAYKKHSSIVDKDTEELLKILEESTTDDNDNKVSYRSDFLSFLLFYNLKSGKEMVSDYVLYKLYRTWSSSPINRTLFNREMNSHFPIKINSKKFYSLNFKAIKLSEFAFKNLQQNKINKTKSKNWKKHFDSFIDYSQIKSGKFYLEDYVLYHFYDKWHYEKNLTSRLSFSNFVKFCKFYFKTKHTSKPRSTIWIAIDKNNLPEYMTSEKINEIRKGYYRVKKTKKSKRTGKISSSQTRT